MHQFLLCGLLLLNLQEQPSYNFFSLDQDAEIGAESAHQADKTLSFIRDANAAVQYVRDMGLKLARSSPAPSLKYRFRIINSRDGDAVTFPAGAVYLDRGLIEIADNDHELAALLAHEIAHAAARHGTEQLSRQLLVQSPASIVAGLLTRESWKEQLAHLGISFGARAPFLRYSEHQEMEANTIAIQILTKSGYSPYALSDILQKIQAATDKKTLAYSYHHPQGATAFEHLEGELSQSKTVRRKLSATPAFRTFHAGLVKLPLPADAAREVASNTLLPNLHNHPEGYYRLGYPEGWLVSPHGANGAIIAPPGAIQTSRTVDNARPGGVQTSRTVDNVGIGVMFDLFDLAPADRTMTLEQATERMIVTLRQSNESPRDPSVGYKVVPGAQLQILIGDAPAWRTVLIGKPGITQPTEIVWLVTRLYYQSLFYLVCVAPQEDFEKYQPVFEQIIRSVELREP
jgi:Zn-dependent protease with chaperone function